MPDDCIFCKIAAGELPAEIVQEDEHTIAFMDINPWTRGHARVIPRYEDDPLRLPGQPREPEEGELAEVAAQLRGGE